MSVYSKSLVNINSGHIPEGVPVTKMYIAKTKSESGARIVSFETYGAFLNKESLIKSLEFNGFVGEEDLYIKVTPDDKIIAEIKEVPIIQK